MEGGSVPPSELGASIGPRKPTAPYSVAFRLPGRTNMRRNRLREVAKVRRLERRKGRKSEPDGPPALPRPDADGYVPALEFVRATIVRDIVRERRAARLTQEELARLSGVRQETICRLEKGLHSPTVRTVEKIENALKRSRGQKRKKP